MYLHSLFIFTFDITKLPLSSSFFVMFVYRYRTTNDSLHLAHFHRSAAKHSYYKHFCIHLLRTFVALAVGIPVEERSFQCIHTRNAQTNPCCRQSSLCFYSTFGERQSNTSECVVVSV